MTESSPGWERRIGRRTPIEPVELQWIAPQVRRGLRRREPTPQRAQLVELSVSGAMILAPGGDTQPGHVVEILWNGHSGTVIVRRVTPTTTPDLGLFGVEFKQWDVQLRDLVSQTLGRQRPEDLESRWHRAT